MFVVVEELSCGYAQRGSKVTKTFHEQAALSTLDLHEEGPVYAGRQRQLLLGQPGCKSKTPQ